MPWRFLSVDELDEFFDYERGKKNYATWIEALMARHGYKTKRALFKKMAHCSIRLVVEEGQIMIKPMHHKDIEGWIGLENLDDQSISLSVNSSPEAIGQALILAFSRCT